MRLQNVATLVALVPYTLGFPQLANFPEYRSLVGLSPEEVRAVVRTFSDTPGAQPLPPPIQDTSAKLVNDPDHPYMSDQPGDIRGPCPALNTLASHGYLPRNGVATPAQIITAVQEGFNMEWGLASFLTFLTFVVDGNHLTNLMSIGANTTDGCQPTPGLNIHYTVEGDASTTRGDYYFGDNYSFNETLFDQLQEVAYSVGGGYVTLEAASVHRVIRIKDSMARNPDFWFGSPRFVGAYGETAATLAFFVSGQNADTTLSATLEDVRSFYQNHKYPKGFCRRQAPYGFAEFEVLFAKIYPLIRVPPGHNEGAGNYVVNPEDDGSACYMYHRQVNLTAWLYSNPAPELRAAIKANLDTFYQTVQNSSCEQYFPYGV